MAGGVSAHAEPVTTNVPPQSGFTVWAGVLGSSLGHIPGHTRWLQVETTFSGYTAGACAEIVALVEPYLHPSARPDGNDSGDILTPWLADPDGPLTDVITTMRRSLHDAACRSGIDPVTAAMVAALRYTPGQHQDWHSDANLDNNRAWVAAVLYLSDPGDYDGGELELTDGTLLRPEQGEMVLVAGHVEHRVRPVTRGVRWAIAGFAATDPL